MTYTHEKTARKSAHLDLSTPPPADVCVRLKISPRPIPEEDIDPDALKIIRRLTSFNYEAYLVGGCIRDLLLGQKPKDFDLATNARPGDIRKLFRNCRLIGRRFRLAHLHFKDQKIIEVATFRRTPTDADDITEQHAAENLFGGPADDAIRRDFTINAMMYDVTRREILDWVGGMEDIVEQRLRTIGDPERRIPEDPVRIIRAAKFATRLNLDIEPNLLAAMRTHAALIQECSKARLIEELFKILKSGCASETIALLQDTGVLRHIMPALNDFAEHHDNDFYSNLTHMDTITEADRSLRSSAFFLSCLLYPACRETIGEGGDISSNLEEIIRPLVAPLPFTRRHMSDAKQIFVAQKRLLDGPGTKRARRLLERETAGDAIRLFALTCFTPEQQRIALKWQHALDARPPLPVRDRPRPVRPVRRRRRMTPVSGQ